jgi:hypothetical protein
MCYISKINLNLNIGHFSGGKKFLIISKKMSSLSWNAMKISLGFVLLLDG